ncbi:MAG: HlyD family secretion protein [Sandaracinaceae bacterium]
MKRAIPVVIVVALVLSGLIYWKIQAQQAELEGPPRGSGVIESEGVDLSARLFARVERIPVHEGESVEAGAVLLELDCAEPEARLAQAREQLAAAQAQVLVARSQAEAASRQHSAARASVGAAGAQIRVLAEQEGAAAREAQRLESMGQHAAAARVDRAQSAATGLAEQERAARASRTAQARQASAVGAQADAATAAAEAAQHNVSALESAIELAEIAVGECHVTAPRAGVVERIYFEEGELVQMGSTVARIVDPSFVRATFYLPNADLAAAVVGAHARVEADPYPDRSFDGEVIRTALEAEFTPRNIQTRSDRDRLVYPIEVRIPNGDGDLRAGMPVTVTLDGAPRGGAPRGGANEAS